MKKKIIKTLILLLLIFITFSTYKIINIFGIFHPGNKNEYDVASVEKVENSILKDKKMIFLGSSVTDGMQSKGISFVDYLSQKHGFSYIKEAVSGTTLVDNGKKSYISRMKNNIDPQFDADIMIVQLSTNDAQKTLPMGTISNSKNIDDFDTSTIIGAIETVIAYSEKTWNVPVVFYTGTKFENDVYPQMIDSLYLLKNKWGIHIIDLWHNLPLESIDDKHYELYMNDPIHPTRAGYRDWWSPVIEESLINILD